MTNDKLTQFQLRIAPRCPELDHLLKLYKADKITLFKANNLFRAIRDSRTPRPADCCLADGAMNATIIYNITGDIKFSALHMPNMCKIKHCKCDPNFAITNTTPTARKLHCFCQLASGKCTDEYMRHTLGLALFPLKYPKQK